MSKTKEKILQYFKENPDKDFSIPQLIKDLQLTRSTAYRSINELFNERKIMAKDAVIIDYQTSFFAGYHRVIHNIKQYKLYTKT